MYFDMYVIKTDTITMHLYLVCRIN